MRTTKSSRIDEMKECYFIKMAIISNKSIPDFRLMKIDSTRTTRRLGNKAANLKLPLPWMISVRSRFNKFGLRKTSVDNFFVLWFVWIAIDIKVTENLKLN